MAMPTSVLGAALSARSPLPIHLTANATGKIVEDGSTTQGTDLIWETQLEF